LLSIWLLLWLACLPCTSPLWWTNAIIGCHLLLQEMAPPRS
jgi:hypothetical protein